MAMMGAGRVLGGGQNVGTILQAEAISHDAVEALLASASASTRFRGSRSMMSFEDLNPSASAVRPFSHRPEFEDVGEDELDEYGLHQPEKKRRLKVDQVQFLEKSFETENKLEPERKLQLARELGLQPRQVAIWFQNRRARWKTKQLEKDYDELQSSFKALKSDYDDLLEEKEKLLAEVQALTDKLLLQEKASSEFQPTQQPSSILLPPPQGKPEDMCSAGSAIIDHDHSQYTEDTWYSSAMDVPELGRPDLSPREEPEGERRLQDGECYSFKDVASWFWSY